MDDIKACVEQFRQGALNSIEAGFDGVEVRWGSLTDTSFIFHDATAGCRGRSMARRVQGTLGRRSLRQAPATALGWFCALEYGSAILPPLDIAAGLHGKRHSLPRFSSRSPSSTAVARDPPPTFSACRYLA